MSAKGKGEIGCLGCYGRPLSVTHLVSASHDHDCIEDSLSLHAVYYASLYPCTSSSKIVRRKSGEPTVRGIGLNIGPSVER